MCNKDILKCYLFLKDVYNAQKHCIKKVKSISFVKYCIL